LEGIFVDELKKEPSDDHPTRPNNNLNNQKKKYPENYRTCINFWKLMYWNVVLLINFLQWFWNVVTGGMRLNLCFNICLSTVNILQTSYQRDHIVSDLIV